MYFTGFSGIQDPRHTGQKNLGSELGSAHVDNLEVIRDESALGGVRSRWTNEVGVERSVWITFMSNAQSTAVLWSGWNKHVLDTANV